MENGNPWKDFEKRNNVVVQRVGAKEETQKSFRKVIVRFAGKNSFKVYIV